MGLKAPFSDILRCNAITSDEIHRNERKVALATPQSTENMNLAHHVLLRVPRDLRAVGPHPERLPDEGLEEGHLVDVRLRHVRVVPLDHLRDLLEDLRLHVGVGGEGVEVEEDRRRRRAQPVGKQRQADDRYVF